MAEPAVLCLIGDEGQAILRAEQERMATRMQATVGHVGSSHGPIWRGLFRSHHRRHRG